MRVLIILISFIFACPSLAQVEPGSSSESTCTSLLNNGRWNKVLQRLEKLDPNLHAQYSSQDFTLETLEKLYIEIKEKTWTLAPRGLLPFKDRPEISEALIQQLKQNFSKQFDFDRMKDESLYLFYVNSLQSLYIYVYQTWVSEVLNHVWPEELSSELKNFGFALLEKSFVDFNPLMLSTPPDSARRGFGRRTYEEFNWQAAFALAQMWVDSSESKTTGSPFDKDRDIKNFFERVELAQSLDPKDLDAIEKALAQPGFRDLCCKSTPGCQFCPNNRAWLKSKDKTKDE